MWKLVEDCGRLTVESRRRGDEVDGGLEDVEVKREGEEAALLIGGDALHMQVTRTITCSLLHSVSFGTLM